MKACDLVSDNQWLLEDDLKGLKEIISDAKDYKYFCLNSFLGHSYDNHGGGAAIAINDLKRIVESHELVELYGGVGQAKFWVDMMAGADSMQKKIDRVNQAIADVEACQ